MRYSRIHLSLGSSSWPVVNDVYSLKVVLPVWAVLARSVCLNITSMAITKLSMRSLWCMQFYIFGNDVCGPQCSPASIYWVRKLQHGRACWLYLASHPCVSKGPCERNSRIQAYIWLRNLLYMSTPSSCFQWMERFGTAFAKYMLFEGIHAWWSSQAKNLPYGIDPRPVYINSSCKRVF